MDTAVGWVALLSDSGEPNELAVTPPPRGRSPSRTLNPVAALRA